MADQIQLHGTWLKHLQAEFDQPYMKNLLAFLDAERNLGKQIYPETCEYFNALNSTPLDQVKVVILGQDPYHGAGQAHGLSFSVPKDVQIPPSLKNIYKELEADLSLPGTFNHGDLSSWADQGVLLLNSVLTVEHSLAASHQNKGWERFTDRVIETVSEQTSNCVFMLWGAYAQKKGRVINTEKHCILKAPHPSPLSAYRGFFGCRHFSRCNEYLSDADRTSIDWSSPRFSSTNE